MGCGDDSDELLELGVSSEKGIFENPEGGHNHGSMAQDDGTLCTKCGHSIGAQECCKFEPTGVTGQRAGERQRQEARRQQEAASLRPRIILSSEDAVTPAQKALARLRERIANKRHT